MDDNPRNRQVPKVSPSLKNNCCVGGAFAAPLVNTCNLLQSVADASMDAAAQSGGNLSLTSTPGRGMTATLFLPASDRPADYPEPGTTGDDSACNSSARAVLLVDDEGLVRTSTAAMLVDAGYKVVEANSASEALSLFKDGLALDAVVTDYATPSMSGVQLAHALQLRQSGECHCIRLRRAG